MTKPIVNDLDERVIVLAPTTRDASTTETILNDVGIACCLCQSIPQLCDEARRGAGAAIVTEEAVLRDRSACVATFLQEQPSWSDLPLLVLTAAGIESPRKIAALQALGPMTLLKRPVQSSTLVSSVRSALRDRRRQYQARNHIVERERQAELLRAANDTLAFALEAGNLGAWQLDLKTGEIPCSTICKRNFGLPDDATLTHTRLLELIHPDDRADVETAIRATIEQGAEYNIEYRNIWPDGSVHWVQVRGRTASDGDGRPVRMAGVSIDITDRKVAEEALRNNVARLKEADRSKDEFLAMLAHELRNPLSAIANASQVARRSHEREHVDWGLNIIEKHVRHLSRMIDDLLDVSRITRGRIELRKEPLCLATILQSAAETARPLLDRKSHTLSIDADQARREVEGDATRLEQVFVNLLNNAAKYTDPGGRIAISSEVDDSGIVVRIKDNGVGMTPELLARAFDLFAQDDRSAARSEGGLGIGLTLVKSLVELHGGTVSVSSAGPGQGSEFTVRLPILDSIAREGPRRTLPERDVSTRGARVLIVEDSEDTAVGMARLLKLLGHEVAVAHDGLAAIEAARCTMSRDRPPRHRPPRNEWVSGRPSLARRGAHRHRHHRSDGLRPARGPLAIRSRGGRPSPREAHRLRLTLLATATRGVSRRGRRRDPHCAFNGPMPALYRFRGESKHERIEGILSVVCQFSFSSLTSSATGRVWKTSSRGRTGGPSVGSRTSIMVSVKRSRQRMGRGASGSTRCVPLQASRPNGGAVSFRPHQPGDESRRPRPRRNGPHGPGRTRQRAPCARPRPPGDGTSRAGRGRGPPCDG